MFFAGIVLVSASCNKKFTPAATTAAPAIQTEANIKTSTAAANESPMTIAGHAIFDAKCGQCHGLKNPADYTTQQWVPIVHRMATKAKLDSMETANVLAYVTSYAKPS